MFSFLTQGTRKAVVLRALLMTAVIAAADWRIEGEIPLANLFNN